MSEAAQDHPPEPPRRPLADVWRDAGELFAVFCSDSRYGPLPGTQLYAMLLPALALGQYAIARGLARQEGTDRTLPAPRAAVLWARVSPQVDRRLRAAQSAPQIKPADWNSGPHHWVIHSPGDQKAIGPLLTDLRRERFAGAAFSAVMLGPGGDVRIIDFR